VTPQPITRRAFVAGGAFAAAGVIVPGQAAARTRIPAGAWHTRSAYRGLIGQSFTVPGSSLQLTLQAVEDLQNSPRGSDHAFALIFHAMPGSPPLPTQVPLLHHHRIGRFHMLLSPDQPSPFGQWYSAVVNRLHA
jgi:hypothetical protein